MKQVVIEFDLNEKGTSVVHAMVPSGINMADALAALQIAQEQLTGSVSRHFLKKGNKNPSIADFEKLTSDELFGTKAIKTLRGLNAKNQS